MTKVLIPASAVALLQKTLDSLESKAARTGVPPKGAQAAAKRGLELRREFGRGGTMVGVARARDIQNGRELSESTIRRMKAYFDRHEVDKQGKDWDNNERPSNGKIAWLLWGGDAGRTWATNLVERWNREDGKKSLPRWLPSGEEITELKHLAAVLCIDEKTAAYVVLESHNPPVELLRKAERYVRTIGGALHYGQPIGSVIRRDKRSWRKTIMDAARGGGITFSFLDGSQPSSGYVVAERGSNKEIPDEQFFENEGGVKELRSYLKKNESKFSDANAYLGLWHDEENYEIVFDVVHVLDDVDEAVQEGKNNNQQAIWDIANSEPIDTGGTGDRGAKGYRNGNSIPSKAAEAGVGDDRGRTRRMGRVRVGSNEGANRKVTDEEIMREDGDWTSRTGTRHYSLGRVLSEGNEEKRQVRDSSYWGAPVGTPLPLPTLHRRSDAQSRELMGIGTHGVVRAAKARIDYIRKSGIGEDKRVDYRKVSADKGRAARIAEAYDELPVDDPKAHKAYDKLAEEIEAQYDYLVDVLGVRVEFVDEDPYTNSFEMMDDIENYNRLRVLKTESTASHPYLTDEQNNKFRAVHDYFGHAATGRGFAQDGEEAAWVSHSLMFSREARGALTTETRGQNSWYNDRDKGFATQKVALLPEEFWELDPDLEIKDVFAADRSGGVMKPVTGPVSAPFEILKPVDRPFTRRRARVRFPYHRRSTGVSVRRSKNEGANE